MVQYPKPLFAIAASIPVELLDLSAEALPFEDEGFDSVVMTWTLCSIVDAAAGLTDELQDMEWIVGLIPS